MSRLRHSNPPRDLSHILPPDTEPKREGPKRRIRDNGRHTPPMLTRDEKLAQKELAEKIYLANNPPRLIKRSTSRKRKK